MTKSHPTDTQSAELLSIRTVAQKDDPSTGLSFFEAENDIPFPIGRFEVFYESAQASLCGLDPAREGSMLLFCPSGAVEVLADTGAEQRRVVLDRPSVGLILRAGVCREVAWLEPGSVLCAAVSDRCSASERGEERAQ